MGAMREDEVSQNAAAVHRRDASAIARLIVVGAVVLALILVGLDNRDDVRIGYVIGDAHAAVWIVVVGAAVGGFIVGGLLTHIRMRRRS